jgi:hypothetical protein
MLLSLASLSLAAPAVNGSRGDSTRASYVDPCGSQPSQDLINLMEQNFNGAVSNLSLQPVNDYTIATIPVHFHVIYAEMDPSYGFISCVFYVRRTWLVSDLSL